MKNKLVSILFVTLILMSFGFTNVMAETCADSAYTTLWGTILPPTAGVIGPPQNITVTNGDASIVVSWDAMTDVTQYRMQINNASEKKTVTFSETTFTINTANAGITVANGTQIQFRVAPRFENDEGDQATGNYSSIDSDACITPTADGGTTTTTTAAATETTTAAATETTTAVAATETTTAAATTETTTVPALPTCTDLSAYKSKMDVNGDGEINALDAGLIMRYIKEACE